MNIAKEILQAIQNATQIVITAHKSPDGDSVGSSLALEQVCLKLGKQVVVCHPDPAPKFLHWLPGVARIINAEEHADRVQETISKADLHIALDYNEPSRTGKQMEEWLKSHPKKTIVIDHHLNPADFADILYSDTTACSTCQLIYEFMQGAGILDLIDELIGTAMYLGIMTDTGSFRFSSVKPITHEIAAHLIRVGVPHTSIHERVFDDNSLDKIQLRAFLVASRLTYLPERKTAYISFSQQDQETHPFEKGDTEGLVNVALSVNGVMLAAFFMETEDGVKISFRSKGNQHPVNTMAATHFEGGGHANAAGGFFPGKLVEAVQKFETILPQYVA